MATPVIRWAIPGVLARSCRPGYPAVRVPLSEVEAWLVAVLAKGISSVLCLLSNGEIELYYRRHRIDLLGLYRDAGLKVAHLPSDDDGAARLTADEHKRITDGFESLPQPVLVHCSAGIERTGRAVRVLTQRK